MVVLVILSLIDLWRPVVWADTQNWLSYKNDPGVSRMILRAPIDVSFQVSRAGDDGRAERLCSVDGRHKQDQNQNQTRYLRY